MTLRRSRRVSTGLAACILFAVLAVLVAAARPQAAGGATTCTVDQLVPTLGDVEITQGAPGYAKLARGKETLVTFFLTKPTACTMGSTQAINVTGATLDVNNTVRTFLGLPAYQSFSAAPAVSNASVAVNSAADPVFAVSADKLEPVDASGNPLTSFTPSFTLHLTYSKKNGTQVVTGQTKAYSNSSTQAKTFDKKSRALRVLVVPMGNGTPGVAATTQFTSADQQSTVNGLGNLNRILPTPTGLDSLGASSARGLRYTIDLAALINLKDPTVPASAYDQNGRFCGSAVNWSAIKGLLERYLEAWNTAVAATGALANPPADRVLGVVGEGISDGYQFGCAEGMASLSSRAAWVRGISDKPASGRTPAQPSLTGALMTMELQHTWGMVPSTRSGTTHSGNVQADVAKPDRAYNVTQRSYVQNDHSVMNFDTTVSPPWNNDNAFDEPADFAYSLCVLGGTTPSPFNNECSTGADSPGTLMGVQAGPGVVASGTTDGTPGGTKVLWSQAVPGNTQLTAGDPISRFRYVRRRSTTDPNVLTNIGFPVSFTGDAHGSSAGDDYTSTVGQFGFALPDAIPAPGNDLARIEIWKLNDGVSATADPTTSNATLLYRRDQQTSPPQLGDSITVTSGGAPENFTNDDTRDDTHPALSRDGQWLAWTQGPQGSTGTCDGPCHFVAVRPTSGSGDPVVLSLPGNETTDAAWGPAQGDGKLPLAFIASGDGDVDKVLFDPAARTFGAPTVLFDGDPIGEGGVPSPHHPTFSRDGSAVAFEGSGNIYRVAADGGTATKLTNTYDAFSPSWSQTAGDDRIAFARDLGGPNCAITQDRSTEGVTPSSITFGNESGRTVDLYWLDYNGGRVFYQTILDGQTAEQPTWITHPWVLIDGAGNCLGYTVSTELQQTYVVQPPAEASYDPDLYTINADGGPPQLLVSNGEYPSWDSDGNVLFDILGDIWRVKSDGTGATRMYSTGTRPTAGSGFSAFERLIGGFDGQVDVMLVRPAAAGQKTVSWQASGPGAENFVSALYLQCGGYSFPVNPYVLPAQIDQAVATFETNMDVTNSCGGSNGGQLCVTVTNGVQTAGCGATDPVAPAGSAPKPPRAAILSPAETTYRADSALALLGNGYDADNSVLNGSHLTWSLDRGLPIPGSNSGNSLDLKPPAGGWPYGYVTITLTVTDDTGQTSIATRRVQILYDMVGGGFLSPVKNPPAYNTANRGTTIPIKWQLKAPNGSYIRDTSTVKAIEYQPAGPGCDFANPTFPRTALPSGGTVLRYDTKNEQFVYNWATPTAAGCYVFVLTLKDETQHQAYFKLS